MVEENVNTVLAVPSEGKENKPSDSGAETSTTSNTNVEQASDTQEQKVPLTNTQKVLEWMGLYYALCTGVNPPWLTVSAGGFHETSFNLGNWLLAGFSAVIGYLGGRAVVAAGRAAVKVSTGV